METKKQNRQRILEATQELFFRHGIKSITMDDVAAHMGMSKKTIYTTFTDKNDLVTGLAEMELECQRTDLDAIHKKSENAIDEILKIMNMLSRSFSKMNPNLFYDLQKFHPLAWKKFKEFKEKKLRSFIEENLKNGIKQQLYRRDLNIKILARLRMAEVEIAFDPSVFQPDQFNVRDVQLELIDHFLHGITTLKGHKLINKYKQITEEE
jgi:TetR/AcrR family transcriptional regulator, cholesterol catabolism regulator